MARRLLSILSICLVTAFLLEDVYGMNKVAGAPESVTAEHTTKTVRDQKNAGFTCSS